MSKIDLQTILKISTRMILLVIVLGFPFLARAQSKIAILSPTKNDQSKIVLASLRSKFSAKTILLDQLLVENIFGYEGFKRPYNLSTNQSKKLGARIGSNFLILIKTDTFRRSSFEKDEYFESFAAFYLVSSRTGKLVFWKFSKFEKDSSSESTKALFNSLDSTVKELLNKIEITNKNELKESDYSIEVLPDEVSNEENFRPPAPYKRLRPKYTDIASLYDILATIDVTVDFDSKGNVTKTEIIRWAGFGLDESVIQTIKKMQWRPAEQNGKPLPIRVLLRYNFKNIDTDK